MPSGAGIPGGRLTRHGSCVGLAGRRSGGGLGPGVGLAGVELARVRLAPGTMRRTAAAQAGRPGHDQRDANGQQHDATDQQTNKHRPKEVRARPAAQIDGHRAARVGVHDHHSPVPGTQVPFEFLGAGAARGCRPKALLGGPGRGLGAGDVGVSDPEGREADLGQLGVLDVAQVGGNVALRGNADEDLLGGVGRGATEHHAAGDSGRVHSPGPGVRHDIQPWRGQGVGVHGVAFRRCGEVAAVALLVVGPAGKAGARQESQTQQRSKRAEHQHDDPARFHDWSNASSSDLPHRAAFSISPGRSGPSLPWT